MTEATKLGPDEVKLKEILARTGYSHEVTSGQRKYGGPPPNWQGPSPAVGSEIYCGKIPKEVYEDDLIPLFEKCGTIWDLRLMMDPATNTGRGFCFVTYTDKTAAENAVREFDNYAIRPGKRMKVNVSTPNVRIFVGNIPKNKAKEEILHEFQNITEGAMDVIIYSVPDDPRKKNRGFCFVDYDCHKNAAAAKKRLSSGRVRVFNCDVIVDWADPQQEPDEETMSKVKVLYVRNLKADVSEEQLRALFEAYGSLEKVKKVKDYGFIHFEDRDCAVQALHDLNGTKLNDSVMTITLAKPPIDSKLKEKRKMQHAMMLDRSLSAMYHSGRGMPGMRGRPGMRPPMMPGRGGFRVPTPAYDDYYGYEAYGAGGSGGYGDEYDYYSGSGYGAYEDYGTGCDDYDYNALTYGMAGLGRSRGRASLGLGSQMPGRARGGMMGGMRPPRGIGMMPPPRGMRGMGRRPFIRGMDNSRMALQRGGGLKRKAAGDYNLGDTKKPFTDNSWGAQPIAQQPLQQSAEWYTDDAYGTQSGTQW